MRRIGIEGFCSGIFLTGYQFSRGARNQLSHGDRIHHHGDSPGSPGISRWNENHFGTTQSFPARSGECFLNPLTLDYDQDVLPLTPKGNATERHLCLAYARKAAEHLEESALRAFWSEKLGVAAEDLKDVPMAEG